jgi:hypothetical protein
MENYILGILGIIISVFLFLIGYRQTIGAKKERIIAANSEVEKIILRRVVLENYTPSFADLSRLLEGKARDFRVKVQELLSEAQILNCIFTRIIETDLIALVQREEIIQRLIQVLSEAESSPINETTVMDLPDYNRSKTIYNVILPIIMALMASIMGGALTVFPRLGEIDFDIKNMTEVLAISITLSMSIIMMLYIFKRLKESQQNVDISSRSQEIEKVIRFERDVAKIINKFGLKYRPAGPRSRGYDFEITINGKPVLIEVKAWNRPMPLGIISRVTDMLSQSVREIKAQAGIIITKIPLDIKNLELDESKVEIMTINQFRNYLAHTITK